MVTGRVPFSGETPLSVALKHKTDIPAQPGESRHSISARPEPAVILECPQKQADGAAERTEVLSGLRRSRRRSRLEFPPAEKKPVPSAVRETFETRGLRQSIRRSSL